MSYILDALKKSDQERQQKNGPDIQTVHKPHLLTRQNQSFSLIMIIAIIFFVIIVIGLGWLYLMPDKILSISVASSPELPPAPIKEPTNILTPVTEPALPRTSPVQTVAPDVVQEFWELPDPVQQAIPAMTFSFHVYSDNPVRRTIIINKQRMREGGLIADDLQLEEITEQGVIFNWKQRYRFSINVVDSW